MFNSHAGMDGGHNPFAIRRPARVVKVMQVRAVGVRLDLPVATSQKLMPLVE